MEPLFENRIMLDKRAMLEWQKREFGKKNRMFTGVHVALIAIYMLMMVFFIVLAVMWRAVAMWVFSVLFLLCAALFLVNLLFRYRLYVWALMRRDKGSEYNKEYYTRFFESQFTPMRQEGDAPGAAQMLRYVEEAQFLQDELADVMRDAKEMDLQNETQRYGLKTRLGELQSRMEALNGTAAELGGFGGNSYEHITDFVVTENLFLLYHRDEVLLLDKRGFTVGDADGFVQFMSGKLRRAAAEAEDVKLRRQLLRAAKALEPEAGDRAAAH